MKGFLNETVYDKTTVIRRFFFNDSVLSHQLELDSYGEIHHVAQRKFSVAAFGYDVEFVG